MNDDVLIVLNDQETAKSRAACELEQQLNLKKISANRLSPCRDIIEVIRLRSPRILVLDYLLGSYGTALDILQQAKHFPELVAMRVVLWTDEPSVYAAVTAMKFGALDYFEMDEPTTITKLVSFIEKGVRKSKLVQSRAASLSFDRQKSYVFESEAAKACLEQIRCQSCCNLGRVVMLGPKGAGRNSAASCLHAMRPRKGRFIELDLDRWLSPLESLFVISPSNGELPLLSFSATVFIDHAEFDGSSLLAVCNQFDHKFFENIAPALRPLLVIGTTDPSCAAKFFRQGAFGIIEIPSLREREHDLLPIIQRLVQRLKIEHDISFNCWDPKLLEVIRNLEWPGNLRQLQMVLVEAISARNSRDLHSLLENICRAKERWERFDQMVVAAPDYHLAERVYKETKGSLRVTAIKLGTTIEVLTEVLGRSQ